MRLIMTRHGETNENRGHIMQGHLPGKLSLLGEEQARKVAYRLRNEKLDYIFSSDLARAFDTAQEIASYHPKVPLEATRELRERYLGDLQGNAFLGEFGQKRWDAEYALEHGLETPEEIFERARNFLNRISKKYKEQNILTTSHNGLEQVSFTYLMGGSWRDIGQAPNFKNTSITIFEIDRNGKPRLKLMNDTSHL